MQRVLSFALIGCAAASASADGLPDGRGVVAPSGSVFASEVGADDCDDYVFAGFAGTMLTASVRVPRGSALAPLIEVLRPGGSLVTADEGLVVSTRRRTSIATFPLDATGTWKVRVRGARPSFVDPPATGAYSVSLATTRSRRAVATLDAPDANGQYRFVIAGQAGARLDYRLTSDNGAPAFNSLLDSRGRQVAGFPGGTRAREFVFPDGVPLGDFVLAFDAAGAAGTATLSWKLVPPKGAKRRVATLSPAEPVIGAGGILPASGGPGAVVSVRASGLADPNAPRGSVGLFLDDAPLADVELLADGVTVRGAIPPGLPEGTYDVVVTSTSGQPAVDAAAFEIVPPPVVSGVEPPYGSALGGSDVTLTGRGFRSPVGLLIDGVLQPVTPVFVDATTVRVTTPPHAQGTVTIGLRDLGSQLDDPTGGTPFEYVTTPVIVRVAPSFLPILAGETITLEGVFFFPTDKVFVETTTPGAFEEITASRTTWVDATHHRFDAPVRPKGEYEVYVEDELGRPNPRKPRVLTYFSFADATAASGLADGPDPWDAVTSTLADLDRDGDLDLVLARRGGATAATTSETRVLRNDGGGAFSDTTAAVMPAAGSDDWRADRVAAADVNADGFADLVLATNSLTVPPAGRSHTRILVNEARGGPGPGAADRVLRDRTADLMAPVRTMMKYGYFSSGGGEVYVSDDWRGLDLWVGDLDRGTAGPPEIVLTHDELKDDDNPNADAFPSGVYCGSYCASPYASAYSYRMYWGGSRAFVWDKTARGGQGRYRFDANFFPRRSGIQVPIFSAPGGIPVPICNASYGSTCRGTFTPFTGTRVAVGDLDHDGKPDVAVVTRQTVQRRVNTYSPLQTISSLQVGLAGFNREDGAKVTDVTPKLTALGLDLRGDALAIGATGFPDGNAFGTIAVARAAPSAASALTLLRFSVTDGVVSVAGVTAAELPAPGTDDLYQASQVAFADVDRDGDPDLVLLAPAAPGGTQSAFRILRNEAAGGQTGVFRRAFGTLLAGLVTPADRREGEALSIGDVTGDGLADFVLTRAASASPGTQTRILGMEK